MLFRKLAAIMLSVGVLVPSTMGANERLKVESGVAPADEAFNRALIEARQSFLQARIGASAKYFEAITAAKRAALDSGDLEQVTRLTKILEGVQSGVKSDLNESLQMGHLLAEDARIVVRGEGFALKVLRNGATAYANRDYQWKNVSKGILGWKYAQIDGGDTPDVRIEATSDGVAYVMAESPKLAESGWVAHHDLAFQWYQARPALIVFSKLVKTGQVINVPHFGWGGTLVLVPPQAAAAVAAPTETTSAAK